MAKTIFARGGFGTIFFAGSKRDIDFLWKLFILSSWRNRTVWKLLIINYVTMWPSQWSEINGGFRLNRPRQKLVLNHWRRKGIPSDQDASFEPSIGKLGLGVWPVEVRKKSTIKHACRGVKETQESFNLMPRHAYAVSSPGSGFSQTFACNLSLEVPDVIHPFKSRDNRFLSMMLFT